MRRPRACHRRDVRPHIQAMGGFRVRRAIAIAAVSGTTAALLLFSTGPASAHEIRKVGAYRFTVGFGDEPAYLDQENFVQFFLATRSGKPVTDLTNSLKLDV